MGKLVYRASQKLLKRPSDLSRAIRGQVQLILAPQFRLAVDAKGERWNLRHLVPISGKDSLATALVQMAREPELHYEYVYNDTTLELPETYEWLDKVEGVMGVKILRLGKSLDTVIREQGILPSPRRRFCTKYSKIYPMNDYIAKDDAILYLGIRADEDRTGGQDTPNITCRYPLKEMGVDLQMVYRIVDGKNLRPPAFFWSRLYEAVLKRMGDSAFVISELPGYVSDRAFAWRSRPNCFMCFYQRRYEWVGLLEHHPDLFEAAERLEVEVGESSNTRTHAYYFIGDGFPLSRIRAEADRIFESRVDMVCHFLRKRLQNYCLPSRLLTN